MSTSPALFGASLQRTAAHADDLVGLIAERMGADPATDLRTAPGRGGGADRGPHSAGDLQARRGTALSVAEDADKAFSLLEESINYPAAPGEQLIPAPPATARPGQAQPSPLPGCMTRPGQVT